MKAVVWHGIGNISLDEVAEPEIKDSTDAILKITVSSICGTDLHMVRGTMAGMKKVVVCSTLDWGECVFCKNGEFACCVHGAISRRCD